MRPMLDRSSLAAIPRLGWAEEPNPVQPLEDLAREAGVGALWVKRDDLVGPLHGSSKTRKLDYLLAAEPWRSAERWASFGAIGSGHLAALCSAATLLGRQLDAYLFWEPLSRGVEDNLAYTATHATSLRYGPGPVSLVLRQPALLLAASLRGAVTIPAGGTHTIANIGLVRAGLELAEQVRAGLLPEPSRLYVALGSGGTAVGLAVGVALGGLRTRVHAVAVVPRAVSSAVRLRRMTRQLVAELARHVALPPGLAVEPPRVRRGFIGGGYGVASAESVAAADRLRAEGVPAEDVYTGKAFACLWADRAELAGEQVLFWMTSRADDPVLFGGDTDRAGDAVAGGSEHAHRPAMPGPYGAASDGTYRDRLPPALRRRLEQDPRAALVRRRLLALGAGVGLLGGVWGRLGFYRTDRPWNGRVLSRREAAIVAAAAEALVPVEPGAALDSGPSWLEVAANVDRYLVGMPRSTLREVHALLTALEQGTFLGGRAARLTRLEPLARRAVLEAISERDPQLGLAVRALRDLCMLGVWQDERTWPAIGYGGPLVPELSFEFSRGRDGRRRPPSRYDALLAPPGAPTEAETGSTPSEDA